MDSDNLILQVYLKNVELDEWLLSRLSEEVGVELKKVGEHQGEAMYFLKKVTAEPFTQNDVNKVVQNKNVHKAFLLKVE